MEQVSTKIDYFYHVIRVECFFFSFKIFLFLGSGEQGFFVTLAVLELALQIMLA